MVQNTYEPKFLDSQCCLYFFHKQYIIISYQKIDVRPVFGPSAGADAKEIRIECVCLLARPDCCRSVDYVDCVKRFDIVSTVLVNKFLKDLVRIESINAKEMSLRL